MRIVLDTNVLVSALGWDGNERAVLLETLSEDIDLLLSESIITEFLNVLAQEKFSHIPQKKISLFIEIIIETSILVETKTKVTIIKEDPDDNRILECAIDGKADYIVSGDKDLLNLGKFKNIPIFPTKDMLKILKLEQ